MTDITNTKLHLVQSFDEVQEFMRWLGKRHANDAIAVDTETGGLEWWNKDLRLVQFGDTEEGWAIPWADWAGVVRQVFKDYEGRFVLHNLKFDRHFFKRFGIDIPMDRADDTMLMAHCIDPTQPIGLKPLSKRLIHSQADAGEKQLKLAMRKSGWTWADVPVDFEPYWVYSALDTSLTAHLYDRFRPQVQASFADIYDLEIATLDVLWRMEQTGARIDLGYVDETHEKMTSYISEAREWVTETYGIKNPTSNRQVIDCIEGKVSGLLTKRTESGNLSLDEEVIVSLKDCGYKWVEDLASTVHGIRKTQKLLKSYFKNFQDMHDDGVLHPSIRQVGARTGRMSISSPALQTLPRGRVVRDAFIPREGNNLVLADFDQVEMRVFAHFAQEEGMIKAIHDGVDLHTFVCRELYGIPEDQEPPREQRQVTKNANFSKVYVAGAATFARTAGIDLEDAQRFLSMYDQRFPGVNRFHKTVENVAMERYSAEGTAYVTTPYGRRHPCDTDKLYKLVNYLIQGTCADLLKEKLVKLDAAGLGDYMILPVHDEVILDVPEAEVEDVAATVKDVMEEHDRFAVPLSVGVDIAKKSWGEKYDD